MGGMIPEPVEELVEGTEGGPHCLCVGGGDGAGWTTCFTARKELIKEE
ncbi:MAG: hypothetical protein LBP88_00240 [Treponema sp.]|nr:hypothetical protein [Treponema sp.]